MIRTIAYVYPVKASFALLDIKYLKKKANISTHFVDISNKWLLPSRLILLFFKLLITKQDSILINFGGVHAFIAVLVARIKRVNSYIILNGVDVSAIPEWEYGYLRGGLIKKVTLISFRLCTKLLPVSESLVYTKNEFAFDKPRLLGLSQHMTLESSQYQIVPNGFEFDFWINEEPKVPNSFVTVIGSANRANLKGLDLIVEIAQETPENTYFIAGLTAIPNMPSNIRFLGYMNPVVLRELYGKSEYYFQLSSWEGFGCALSEAMLCGCIPIVSNVNVLPEIVGTTGLILESREASNLLRLLERMEMLKSSLSSPRNQIVENYRIEDRIDRLLSVLN